MLISENLIMGTNIASYTSDSFGAGIQFGLPISDIERIGLNLNYDNTSIDTGSTPASQILAFTQSEVQSLKYLKHNFHLSKVTLIECLFQQLGSPSLLLYKYAVPGSSFIITKINLQA